MCRRDLSLKTKNPHKTQTSMSLVGFEPAIPRSDRPQTLALDRLANGIDIKANTEGILFQTFKARDAWKLILKEARVLRGPLSQWRERDYSKSNSRVRNSIHTENFRPSQCSAHESLGNVTHRIFFRT